MKRIAIAFALLAASAGACAADLSVVKQRLAQPALLRGQFVQDKQVQGFDQPLHSSGDFVVARGKGVLWRTRQPFPNLLAISRERIRSFDANGKLQGEMDAKKQPALRMIDEIMFALMAGDVDALSARFKLDARAQGSEGWSLTLVPSAKAVARALDHVELQGARYIREVKLVDAHGAATVLRFDALSEQPALSADEEARLE